MPTTTPTATVHLTEAELGVIQTALRMHRTREARKTARLLSKFGAETRLNPGRMDAITSALAKLNRAEVRSR